MDSISKFESDVIAKKTKSKELNKKGNKSFLKKKYLDAEKFYSQAIELNPGSRPIRTNRAEWQETEIDPRICKISKKIF